MPGIYDQPNDQFVVQTIGVEATAGTARSTPVWRAPANAVITGARWIPGAAVTGANTNFFSLQVINKTATTNVTSVKDYVSGTNSVAATAESLTLTTAAGVNCAAGDVIALDRTVTGTGLAGPAGAVELTYRWR